LSPRRSSLVGDDITLADICFATELVLFMNERQRVQQLNDRGLSKILHHNVHADYPLTMAHFARLAEHPNFKPDIEPYLRKLSAAAQGVSVTADG
jgi:elongation factor 1-gamma